MTLSNRRLYTLDALRGIAAVLVLLFHFHTEGVALAPSGYLAVDFFFLLSGFVIARTYDAQLGQGFPFWQFAALRAIRLYPLFLVGLAIGVLRSVGQIVMQRPDRLDGTELAVSLVSGLFMLPSPATDNIFPINGPGWSLFFEMAINLAYASVLVGAGRRTLYAMATACGALLVGMAIVKGSLGFGNTWEYFHGGMARVGFSFTVGLILARLQRTTTSNSRWALLPMLALVVLLVLPVQSSQRVVYDLFFAMVASPLLVWFGASFDPPRSLQRAATSLGEWSYPIYVIHYPALLMAAYAARKIGASPALWMPAFVAAIVIAAWALNATFDKPIRKRLNEALRRASAVRVPAAVPSGSGT